MSGELCRPRLLATLPFDVLLRIFSECGVGDVLNLSAVSLPSQWIASWFLTVAQTCKTLNKTSEEHQAWFNQATRLQIPIPADIVLSTTELKDWVISWVRVRSDKLWVKPRDDRSLRLHWFNMRDEDQESAEFVMANLVPGGKFVVVLYTDGQIDLKEIKIKSEDEWNLRNVAHHEQDGPQGFYAMFWSQLLTETSFGRPLVACIDEAEDR